MTLHAQGNVSIATVGEFSVGINVTVPEADWDAAIVSVAIPKLSIRARAEGSFDAAVEIAVFRGMVDDAKVVVDLEFDFDVLHGKGSSTLNKGGSFVWEFPFLIFAGDSALIPGASLPVVTVRGTDIFDFIDGPVSMGERIVVDKSAISSITDLQGFGPEQIRLMLVGLAAALKEQMNKPPMDKSIPVFGLTLGDVADVSRVFAEKLLAGMDQPIPESERVGKDGELKLALEIRSRPLYYPFSSSTDNIDATVFDFEAGDTTARFISSFSHSSTKCSADTESLLELECQMAAAESGANFKKNVTECGPNEQTIKCANHNCCFFEATGIQKSYKWESSTCSDYLCKPQFASGHGLRLGYADFQNMKIRIGGTIGEEVVDLNVKTVLEFAENWDSAPIGSRSGSDWFKLVAEKLQSQIDFQGFGELLRAGTCPVKCPEDRAEQPADMPRCCGDEDDDADDVTPCLCHSLTLTTTSELAADVFNISYAYEGSYRAKYVNDFANELFPSLGSLGFSGKFSEAKVATKPAFNDLSEFALYVGETLVDEASDALLSGSFCADNDFFPDDLQAVEQITKKSISDPEVMKSIFLLVGQFTLGVSSLARGIFGGDEDFKRICIIIQPHFMLGSQFTSKKFLRRFFLALTPPRPPSPIQLTLLQTRS
jgi:hypothetical protein